MLNGHFASISSCCAYTLQKRKPLRPYAFWPSSAPPAEDHTQTTEADTKTILTDTCYGRGSTVWLKRFLNNRAPYHTNSSKFFLFTVWRPVSSCTLLVGLFIEAALLYFYKYLFSREVWISSSQELKTRWWTFIVASCVDNPLKAMCRRTLPYGVHTQNVPRSFILVDKGIQRVKKKQHIDRALQLRPLLIRDWGMIKKCMYWETTQCGVRQGRHPILSGTGATIEV